MKLFTHSLFALFLFFSVMSVMNAQEMSEDLKKHFAEQNDKLAQSVIDDDMDAILAFYTDDVIDMPAYHPMMRGKEEVADEMKKNMEMDEGKITKFSFTVKEVIADGDLAVDVGTYSLLYESPQMPNPWPDEGNYVTVWEKQDDGSWLIKASTWNSHNNPWLDMMEEHHNEEHEVKDGGSTEVHSHGHDCSHDCTEKEQKNCEHHKEEKK